MTKEISPRDDSGEPCECGHDESWHMYVRPPECDFDDCPCKKFKAKKEICEFKCELNKENNCRVLNKELGNCELYTDGEIQWRCVHYKKFKPQKEICKWDVECGKDGYLCSECEPKNHSPKEIRSSGASPPEDKEPDGGSKNNSSGSDDESLSSKKLTLYRDMNGLTCPTGVFRNENVKESVKKLKDNLTKRLLLYKMDIGEATLRDHEKKELVKEEINKIFGKGLTNG